MQCPSCGTHNPAQARFCLGCGRSLINGIVCAACHTVLPPHARYCYHCGTFLGQYATVAPQAGATPDQQLYAPPPAVPAPVPPTAPAAAPVLTPTAPPELAAPPEAAPTPAPGPVLGQLPAPRPLEEMLPYLQHYLPQALYEPLERRPREKHLIAVREHLAALLRTTKTYLPWPVVVAPQPAGEPAGGMYRGVFLFGDVSGFTPLSESLKRQADGAERVAEIINELFTELVNELFRHGGTLLKFGGDALLGLFPAESDEEMAASALKAAQAGRAMLEVMKQDQFAAIEAGGETRALKIKCGISAGPYFAAHIGTEPGDVDWNGTMAYVTTGHTVNLAEQSEGHANPGEVAMTKAVRELLGDRVAVGPVTKEPDEDFFQLLQAPAIEKGATGRAELEEPPEGELQAQITYLVERLNRLTPYLSDELVSRVKDNPDDPRIAPEYRPVTVMFANYKGISDLIEKMGETQPELITARLNDYFVHMNRVVEKYEGTLARMDQYAVGDRLVIFFGAPRAHEDDPVRAVYTALEMHEAVRKNFSALRTSTGVYRFEQRIGINTGFLFSGNAGAPDLRQEYTLMGDDINMAARLMSYAKWGKTYISNKTEEHVAPFFELSDRFDLKVKGKAILIPTYDVLGRREKIGRTRGLAGRESPLTGRDEVLETLRKCGQGLLNKRGQIVSIIGDSGLGKSRSRRELRDWLFGQEDADEVLWLEDQALSFSEQTSYWLAVQMLRGALEIGPDATEDDVLFTLWERGQELLGEDAMEAVPFLAHLMGLELGDEWAWVKEVDPKVRQKQTFWAAREFFAQLAHQRPLVITLDDLHWADEASLDLIEALLEVTDRAPLMFCLVFRARRDKACWRLRDRAASGFPHRYTEVPLQPLSRDLTRYLLAELLPGAKFPDDIENEILTKVAGNPFYLEEVVRSLLDDKAVVPDPDEPDHYQVIADRIAQITVPDSLQGAIVARIDRLTDDAREALQMAAVIGKQFELNVLRSLPQVEAQLDALVAQLERSGLVRPSEITGDPTYAFPDGLVQEVAYESLLVKKRHQFHRQIGEALETMFAERLEQECERLAYHFSRSDDHERAIKYLEMAANKAKKGYANAVALQHYDDLLTIKRELGDQAGQAGVLYQMGVTAYGMGDYERARPWLEEAISLYQTIEDPASEGWSVLYLGMVDLKQANYAEAARHHQHALDLSRSRKDTFQEGIHLTNLARVTLRLGDYDLALRQFQQSLELKKQNNDAVGQGWALHYMGLIHVYQDEYDQAESVFQAALALWQQDTSEQDMATSAIGAANERLISYGQQGLGLLALGRGQFERAQEHFQEAYELADKLVLMAESTENLSYLGQAHLGLGKLDEAYEVSERAMALLAAQKDVEEVQRIYLNHYRVLAAREDPEASALLKTAYDIMMDQASRISEEDRRQVFLEQVKVNQEINALLLPSSQAAA